MPPAHRLTVQQRSSIVKLYYENGNNANLTVRLFNREYTAYRGLHRSTVSRVVKKFEECGTVENQLKKHCGRKITVTGPGTVNQLRRKLKQNPSASIRRLRAETGLSVTSIQRVLKRKLHLKPYRPARVQALNVLDPNKRLAWAEAFLKATDLDWTYPNYIVWTDEAIFHLNGHVNRHNAVTWARNNPHALIEVNTQKKAGVMVWMGLLKDSIIGPYFINGSLTGEVYLNMLENEVWPSILSLVGDEEDLITFQQDGASSHYYKNVREWLDITFEDRWMGRAGPIPWPARSPDLSPLDFWLWEYLKNKVYAKPPETLADLKTAIRQAVQAIPSTMINNAILNVKKRAETLITVRGRQLGMYRM